MMDLPQGTMADVAEMDMGVIPMVLDMMRFGIRIDREAFDLLDVMLSQFQEETRGRILATDTRIPRDFNPGSSQQCCRVIFDTLRVTHKFGYNTNDKVLSRIVSHHPIVPLIQEWREYRKLITSYARAVPKLADPNTDRIHAQFQLTRTDTGRLSCKAPNLMAQPVRSTEGRLIRDCYISDPDAVFLSSDYSGIEMRICAHVSQDPNMLRVFREGLDLHSQTAAMMFGIPVSQVDESQHRYPAKRIGFGILYGLTAPGLQREMAVAGLDWDENKCAQALAAWFDVYRGVRRYMEEVMLFARRYGYVQDLWGRVRLVPNVHSPTPHVRSEAERQAGNAPIQMGAQGVIKTAMAALTPFYRAYLSVDKTFRPIIQIHDDLVFEIGDDIIDEASGVIKAVMEGVRGPGGSSFSIPILVDQKAGKRWGSLRKLGKK